MYGLNDHNPSCYVLSATDKHRRYILKTTQNTAVAVYKI